MPTDPDIARIAEGQQRKWANDLRGAAMGNPYATLCSGCQGRHAPPRNELCPKAHLLASQTRGEEG